jgi:hypothetical protein
MRLTLEAEDGATRVAVALVSGMRLAVALAVAAPARKPGDSSAERGQHTIPMIAANANTVTPSHMMSPASITRLPPTIGVALVGMIHL